MSENKAFDQKIFYFKNKDPNKKIIIDFFKDGISITTQYNLLYKTQVFLTRNQIKKIAEKYDLK